jgi:FG-GAP repeat
LQQRLAAGDAAAYDSFGISVSLSGEYAMVGTYGDDDNGSDSGSAYVFVRNGTVWSQQQKLIAPDGAASDYFGWAVGISGDKAIVGAYGDDDVAYMCGSAYGYKRNGSVWTFEQKIKPTDLAHSDHFGKAISISGDTALIGSPQHTAGASSSGAAYLFQRGSNSWSLQKKLTASDGRSYDNFGVAVSLDNGTALVGADKDDNKGENSGSAYVFVRNGSTWSQQKVLTAADGAAEDLFGSAVSISGDTALIGAPGDDDQGWASGSAYAFVRTGTTWSQQQKLIATDTSEYDSFGCAVSVSRGSALVGASRFNSSESGFAYLFWRIGPVWQLQQKLQAPDGGQFDRFGIAVCLSDRTALVGATLEDGPDNLGGIARDQGSVHVFYNSNPDIDGDGVLDAYETGTGVYLSSTDTGTDPFSADSDHDGLGDSEEINSHGTNPNNADSDGDNYLDATEITETGNPLDAGHRPGMQPKITRAKQLTFFSREGVNYRVEGSETGIAGTWVPRLGPILGTGQVISVVVPLPPPHLRIVESP